jgi:hypothetical protein
MKQSDDSIKNKESDLHNPTANAFGAPHDVYPEIPTPTEDYQPSRLLSMAGSV